MLFESSVNSYGGKTHIFWLVLSAMFESSVNSYGGKTIDNGCCLCYKFESSVNSYGGKTIRIKTKGKKLFESSVVLCQDLVQNKMRGSAS